MDAKPAQTKNLKYYLYTRKSTEEEERQQLSIPAQLRELNEYAEREGLEIVDILTESKTAKKPGRKVFNKMLEKIEQGDEGNAILAWHPDRLARNAIDSGRILHLLDTKKLLDLKFSSFWFQNSSEGLFLLSIAFGQSKYFIDLLSENTARGLRQKVGMGWCPGVAPRGYLNDRGNKTIILDKKLAPLIEKVFKLYSRGTYSLESLAVFLAQKGILSSGGIVIKKDVIKNILTNPFYYGQFIYKGELYDGKHPPIISKKLFDRVQTIIKRRGHAQPKEPHNLPFAGFIRCGECGMTITGEIKIKHYKTINRKATYIYYHCTKKHKTRKCFQDFINEKDLVPQINRAIQKVSLRRDWGLVMLERLKREKQEHLVSQRAIAQEFKDDLEKINQKLKLLLDSYIDQVIERDDYLGKKRELVSQKRTLEEKIIELEQSPGNNWLGLMRDWIELALSGAKIADDLSDYRRKRNFLISTGSDFFLQDKKLRCCWQNPWKRALAGTPSRSWERETGIAPVTFSLATRRSTPELLPQ